MWNPIWGFDFKVTILKHIVTMVPGQQISVPITITKIRGKPQKLDLDVNTNWESMGLYAKVHFDFTTPMPEWTGTLEIKSSPNTPPDSYLFTVRASAQGTFHTSEDAITVIVEPKDKEKKEDAGKQPKEEDREDFFQPKQPAQTAGSAAADPSSSFSLDKLFQPGPAKPVASSGDGIAGGKPPSAIGLIIGIMGVIVFAFILIWIARGGGFGPTRTCVGGQVSGWPECSDCSGNWERTIYNGKDYGMCRATKVRTDNPNLCTFTCK